jgi:hypothetical protein
MLIESCPCCGNRLLRHARNTGSYLRCKSCWLEIPSFVVAQGEESQQVQDFQGSRIKTTKTAQAV